jgi:hypothetical protein
MARSLARAAGEADSAFAWLHRGLEQRSEELVYMKVDPAMDPIRDDPRYTELLRRLGLDG